MSHCSAPAITAPPTYCEPVITPLANSTIEPTGRNASGERLPNWPAISPPPSPAINALTAKAVSLVLGMLRPIEAAARSLCLTASHALPNRRCAFHINPSATTAKMMRQNQ